MNKLRSIATNNDSNDERHQLKILNSFTRKKGIFSSNEAKTIKWYSCGPTVYDVSHLGHARCYITFDIIRRILSDYFGYHVFYVMNITDIDDKIIKRARSNHLGDLFIQNFIDSLDGCDKKDAGISMLSQLSDGIQDYANKLNDEKDPFKIEMISNIVKKSHDAIRNLKALISNDQMPTSRDDCLALFNDLREVIAEYQDSRLGHSVNDLSIFKDLALRYEQEFHEDMQKLDIIPPCSLTRVSDFIGEIGAYIQQIEANGFAYRSGGSVYFDTNAFEKDPKHSYAKLLREAYGQEKAIDDGEGELSVSSRDSKKSPNDFALWKKSKPGEPSWKTLDYEAGRPGWHIECSVMASQMLGENFDIHSGGCDLKFPHHDNEIAQAEAYYNTGRNWVNYFIHSGHLSISGCKMSKSLKNFITIRQALGEYTSRQLRFAFLAHSWSENLDYSPNTMNTAITYEKTFKEFLLNLTDRARREEKISRTKDQSQRICGYFTKWSDSDHELSQEYFNAIKQVDIALCDNFDTRTVLNILSSLVKGCNKRPDADLILTKDISLYIVRILRVFGVEFSELMIEKTLLPESVSQHNQTPKQSDTEAALKYVEALAQFRADIRRISKTSLDPSQGIKDILTLCDNLRDKTLPDLGIRLEDREVDGAQYAVKILDPETIAREKASAEKREQDKRLREETAKLEKLKIQQQREDKMKINPMEMFRGQTDKYSAFDEKGLPTHDVVGKEISKSALKKILRIYAEQEARYTKYLSELQGGNS